MELLQQARAEIDAVDAEMAALFERRMQAVARVAQSKAASGKPVFDPERERAVIAKNTARIQNPELRPYYQRFITQAMAVSRAYQRKILGRNVAAYQGVQGAWAQIALQRIFPFAKQVACQTWADVFDLVSAGQAEFGVLPFENSNAGDVSTVLDLLYAHPELSVAGMYDLPIRQDLLGVPGATLEGLRTVISHQQALSQSGPFLRAHHLETKVWGNTADAARHVAELADPKVGAIASAETARLYGLSILAEGINEDGDNTTRFIVIHQGGAGEQPVHAGQRIALLFTVDHKPGKLAQVIERIGGMGFNMESIKSRPLPHVQFEYYFFVQLICPAGAEGRTCRELLANLQEPCRTVRLLGVFDRETRDAPDPEKEAVL
ncbi:bifunctional chorismate mutase/prephenate dehydratase [uncultured Gemmiger sp.]|uniref:bifunctional chorismate mutase/prephenate dehydratase n=1 Tax=uncultured Gemmiger sp. TaxID=1623490 RepID=UPI0025EE1178|nr:bifunctional chorismate mutase/prephenate dehydratase [uncultured Gemmiger sp.]